MTHDKFLESITAQRHAAAVAERQADRDRREEDICRQIDKTYKGIAVRRAASYASFFFSMCLSVLCVFALAAGNFPVLTTCACLCISGIAFADMMADEAGRMERGRK